MTTKQLKMECWIAISVAEELQKRYQITWDEFRKMTGEHHDHVQLILEAIGAYYAKELYIQHSVIPHEIVLKKIRTIYEILCVFVSEEEDRYAKKIENIDMRLSELEKRKNRFFWKNKKQSKP